MTGPTAGVRLALRCLALTAALLGGSLALLWFAVLGGTALSGVWAQAVLAVGAALCGLGSAALAYLVVLRPVMQRLGRGEVDAETFPALARRIADADRDRDLLAGLTDAYNRLLIEAQTSNASRQQERSRLFRDIEAHKAELIAARDIAESEALGRSRFFAGMTHELRTPLTAIMGFSEAIEKQIFGPDRPDKYIEYARDIRVGGEHLLETINHLLDLAKAEAGKFELQEREMDVGGAIEDCVNLLRQMAESREIKLSHVRDITLPPYLADGQIIKQVIINLLSNAIKFTPPGQSVTIQAGLDSADDLFIAVRDTGLGISREDLSRIFEPFQQGARSGERQGTGLGLSLSRVFVQLHGGELRIESTEGQGTTAVIQLPAWRWRRAAGTATTDPAISDDQPSGGGADVQVTRSVAAQSK